LFISHIFQHKPVAILKSNPGRYAAMLNRAKHQRAGELMKRPSIRIRAHVLDLQQQSNVGDHGQLAKFPEEFNFEGETYDVQKNLSSYEKPLFHVI
jgi:hypothetical protein